MKAREVGGFPQFPQFPHLKKMSNSADHGLVGSMGRRERDRPISRHPSAMERPWGR